MKLYYNTISTLLLSTLNNLMQAEVFTPFRLVGGTSLSLQLGHRESVDIDLFTDAEYGSIDFDKIEKYLTDNFKYVDSSSVKEVSMGKSYYIGESEKECIKLDLFYTDKFIRSYKDIDGIRLATLEEVAAMKIDVVARGGRKKDFWDIHELNTILTITQMVALHKERYPYSHNLSEIMSNFINFNDADLDFDPICLKGKYWEIIKLDIIEWVTK